MNFYQVETVETMIITHTNVEDVNKISYVSVIDKIAVQYRQGVE